MRAETAGFQKTSHEYERGRPGYPADAADYIAAEARAGTGEVVVDLAAGTGKLTRELVSRGLRVVAVEPLDEMRARLVELLPGVTAVGGTAHATGLEPASAAAVTVAQAFHWFSDDEALAEIARVLRPGGRLILVWNRRDLNDPVQSRISRLTASHVKEAPSYSSGEWERVLGSSPLFRAIGHRRFRLCQRVDRRQIVDRVGSTSYIANLDDAVRLPLLDEIAALVPEGGEIDLPYDTDVYVYELAS